MSIPGLTQPITVNVSAGGNFVSQTGVLVSLPISTGTSTCTTVTNVNINSISIMIKNNKMKTNKTILFHYSYFDGL